MPPGTAEADANRHEGGGEYARMEAVRAVVRRQCLCDAGAVLAWGRAHELLAEERVPAPDLITDTDQSMRPSASAAASSLAATGPPGAFFNHAPMPRPHGLPGPIDLGEITPGDPAPVPVDEASTTPLCGQHHRRRDLRGRVNPPLAAFAA